MGQRVTSHIEKFSMDFSYEYTQLKGRRFKPTLWFSRRNRNRFSNVGFWDEGGHWSRRFSAPRHGGKARGARLAVRPPDWDLFPRKRSLRKSEGSERAWAPRHKRGFWGAHGVAPLRPLRPANEPLSPSASDLHQGDSRAKHRAYLNFYALLHRGF